jgi:hypothetical protein
MAKNAPTTETLMSSENAITRKQHFVPRFYLRRFLNGNNEVEVLDSKQLKCLPPKGTRGICYEDFFYGIRTGQPDAVSQHVENNFRDMEHEIGKRIDPIISKLLNSEQVLDKEKWIVAWLMSMIWVRGPAMRWQVNRISEKVLKHVNEIRFSVLPAEKIFDKFDKKTGITTDLEVREKVKEMMLSKDYSLEFSNEQHLMMFDDIHKFANLFYAQHWLVYISKLPQKFVTSDNPVVVVIPKSKSFYPPSFLERTHYFALTPEICIEANYPNDGAGKKLKRKILFRGSEKEVLNLNTIIGNQAHQYIYAKEKQDLEDILAEVKFQKELFATPEGKIIKQNLDAARNCC